MRKTSVPLEPVLLSNMDRKKEYRDRKTHERKTMETVKEHEKEHPVHQPYSRQKVNWTKLALDDEYDNTIEF